MSYLSEEKDPFLTMGDVVVEIMDSDERIRVVITAHSDKIPQRVVRSSKVFFLHYSHTLYFEQK